MGDRHLFRANWHHYQDGAFFITICSHEKEYIFGNIKNAEINLSPIGEIVSSCITDIPLHNKMVEVWNSVIMPNHVHLVLFIQSTTAADDDTTKGCLKNSNHGEACTDFHHNSKLATVVGSFKSAVTKRVHEASRHTSMQNAPVWQSRYHDAIIRNRQAFDEIMRYIDSNIINWHNDCFFK